MATQATTAAGPVVGGERIEVIDVLRGFALWGILLINITAFKAPGAPPGFLVEGSIVDRAVIQALVLFVESKFFTLFSFLFGLGFAIQLLRAQERGVPFVPRFTRRLLVLLFFGVAHVVLLWDGDILVVYALVGFLLLLFRNRSPRALLRWAAVLLFVPLVLITAGLVTLEIVRSTPPYAVQIQEVETAFQTELAQLRADATAGYGQGAYANILQRRIVEYAGVFPLLVSRVPSVLAMFLLGLYVGKRNILGSIADHMPLLRRVRLWGLSAGLLTSLLVVVGLTQLEPVSALVVLFFNQALAGPVLAMGYAATIVLLIQRSSWQRRFQPLAATGRMALTNYLMQSVIYTTLFYGYGFGLTGQVNAVSGVLLATGIYALQTLWSLWWLRHFQFGPLEWVWRSLTYGRWQPLRRAAQARA